MTTIKATPHGEGVEIEINLTHASASRITRTDKNGTHDLNIIGLPRTTQGIMRWLDWTAAAGNVSYQLYVNDTTTTFGTPTIINPLDRVMVLSPRGYATSDTSEFDSPPGGRGELLMGYTTNRQDASVIHEIPGRPDPIIVERTAMARRGTVDIQCKTHLDAMAVEKQLMSSGPQLIKVPGKTADLHAHITNANIGPDTAAGNRTRWRVTASYLETEWI